MKAFVAAFSALVFSSFVVASIAQATTCASITARGQGRAPGGGTGANRDMAQSVAKKSATDLSCARAKDALSADKAGKTCQGGCTLEKWEDSECSQPSPTNNGTENPKLGEEGKSANDANWKTACEREARFRLQNPTAKQIADYCRDKTNRFWALSSALSEITSVGTCVPDPFGPLPTPTPVPLPLGND